MSRAGDTDGRPSRRERAKIWFRESLAYEQATWTNGTLSGFKDDVFAGLTVAVAQVPQAVAFAVIGKVPPKLGLFSTFYLGFIMAVFGGRSGAIYGAAGALAVEFPKLVELHGEGALLAATILSGFFCLLPAIFRVTDYIRLLPNSVMIGFVDGLAIVIFRGTMDNFKDSSGEWIVGMQAFYTCLIFFVSLAVIWLMPIATKIVPSTIVAVVIGTALNSILRAANVGTTTVGDKYNTADAFLVAPSVPDMQYSSSAALGAVFVAGLVYAIIGAVESLMTQILLDKATKMSSSMDREMAVFGFANVINGFFGGMSGCALVGPTILNLVSGGGHRRLSGTINALLTLLCIYVAAPVIDIIPLGALSAVTATICIRTFDWATFTHFFRMPVSDILVVMTVTIVTVFTDLAIGVACGVGVALLCLVFTLRACVIWDIDRGLEEISPVPHLHDGARIVTVRVHGLLFFGSAPDFIRRSPKLIDGVLKLNPTDVVFDLSVCTVQDFGGIETLEQIAELLRISGVRVHLRNTELSGWIMKRASPYFVSVVPSNATMTDSVRIHVASSKREDACGPMPAICNKITAAVEMPYPHNTVVGNVPVEDGTVAVATTYVYLSEHRINLPVCLIRGKEGAVDRTQYPDAMHGVLFVDFDESCEKMTDGERKSFTSFIESKWGVTLVSRPAMQAGPKVAKFVFGRDVQSTPKPTEIHREMVPVVGSTSH